MSSPGDRVLDKAFRESNAFRDDSAFRDDNGFRYSPGPMHQAGESGGVQGGVHDMGPLARRLA